MDREIKEAPHGEMMQGITWRWVPTLGTTRGWIFYGVTWQFPNQRDVQHKAIDR